MEESTASTAIDGEITAIQFGLASDKEIRRSSISDCPINHASQLANPFLGLPLEIGKCESCGTAEVGKCEGHFGYIELPIPVYHPSHISELRRMLSLLCLKCLKSKTSKSVKNSGVMERLLSSCCEETSHVSIKESKTNDGAVFLELRLPAKYRVLEGSWDFLERYGYRYGVGCSRPLLPSEVHMILKKLPAETRRKLVKKGYFPQDGYILHYLPVPPNCLSVPDISDGVSVMSSDLSTSMLKKVLRQIEVIRSSRSGDPNFEAHEVEANELQIAVSQYIQVRGTGKAARDADHRYGVNKEGTNSSTKAWLDKMRTLFISKGSGFSSRSVITGDAYKPVNEIGLPSEIAKKMTFEERVNMHNIQQLQSLVDKNLCLTFRDGLSTYSLREGSKGHTYLKLGQIVHRRIMDGDIVFINRPPTTHKHSLQALRVYIHDDHTVKINPLMCGPLAADFDGDCVHLFYPQSLSARAEVVELFSVEKQLLSSHSGNLNLQLATDSLLSLKTMFKTYFLNKKSAQQLAMYASTPLPSPALFKPGSADSYWTALQVLQTALPSHFDCQGERLLIRGSEVIKLDFNRDVMTSVINEILTSLFFNKSPKDALNFLDSLQPLLMENIFAEGFSVALDDFFIPISDLQTIQSQIQDISPLLVQLRSSYNELIQVQFESYIRLLKVPIANYILTSSVLGNLIDSRSDSAIEKVVQQIGFLGLQLSDRRKFYSKGLVEDMASLFHHKYPFAHLYPSEEFGLVKSCFVHGLDPYEEMAHSIATREVIVRSSKGLAEPGTLFKNLMAILRDVVVCYDGTVRNISSNSIIQFEYGVGGVASQSLFPAGEPVGVLAATAMSNPAYKAVLDSSPTSNSSWDMMKEILFCRVNFKNDMTDRRVILYLNDCHCGRKYCQENASYVVKNHLQKVSLRDAAVEFLVEYKQSKSEPGSSELDAGLVGHIHLNKALVHNASISMLEILQKCEDEVKQLRKKKKYGVYFKMINLSVSECCFFQHSSGKWSNMPCLKFFWPELTDIHLEKMLHIMADMICPILLDTVIKGDPRISTVSIIWTTPSTTTWVENPSNDSKGELAVEVTLEKTAVRQSGDAWRIVLDCCLPVFHLIDTKRSIPYAIKQIQDLFGISCAFDQVVQRLSTSVTSVTKGVLKEHLLLLASSMTCAGNLIGFNMSGIKALCRALSVQVPFTEATLYTPRKCFERASEKCHVDSLSSIVASCSWGKRVAVGTGAKFDILWDKKETGIDEQPIDVYNFLQLVRGSNEEEIDAGCLGEDVDRFDWDDSFLEPALSPEQENKAVFEDTVEVGSGQANSSWDLPSSNTESSNWSNCAPKKDEMKNDQQQEDSTNASGWSNWGSKKDHSKQEDSSKASGWSNWGSKKDESKDKEAHQAGEWSNWGLKKDESQEQDAPQAGGWSNWGSKKDQSKEQDAPQASGRSNWGSKEQDAPQAGGWSNWGSKKDDSKEQDEPQAGGRSNWGSKKDQLKEQDAPQDGGRSNWGSKEQDAPQTGGLSNWGSKKDQSKEQDAPQTGGRSNWGSNEQDTPQAGGWSNWGSKKVQSKDEVSPKAGSLSGWGSKKDQGQQEGSDMAVGWNTSKSNATELSSTWGKKVNEGANVGNGSSKWGMNKDQQLLDSSASDWDVSKSERKKQPWGKDAEKSTTWGQPSNKSGGWTSEKGNGQSGSKSWDSKKKENEQPSWAQESGATWGSAKVDANDSTMPSSQGWGTAKAIAFDDNKKQGVWHQPTASKWNSTQEDSGKKRWETKKDEGKTSSPWGGQGDSSWKNPTKSTVEWGSNKSSDSTWKNSRQEEDGTSGAKGWGSKKEESKTSSPWGGPGDSSWKKPTGSAVEWGSKKPNDSNWKNSKQDCEFGSREWGSKKEESKTPSLRESPSDSTWKNSTPTTGEWDSKKSGQPSTSVVWGSAKADAGAQNEKPSALTWKNSEQREDSESASGGWGSKKEANIGSTWGTSSDTKQGSSNIAGEWEFKKSIKSSSPLGWGSSNADFSDKHEKQGASTWKSSAPMEVGESGSKVWGSQKDESNSTSWGASSDSTLKISSQSVGEWDAKKSTQSSCPQAWGSAKADIGNESDKQDVWRKNFGGDDQASDALGEPQGSQGWDSPKGNESESQSPWGQPGGSAGKRKRPEGGRGWGSSNSGEWKNRKSRPPKHPGAPNDNSTGVGLTATRKRMDLFVTEEQDALLEAETVMQSCRRILHQSGYNDGDPLPAEDQSFIINNILSYHPDKAAKIGSGVDYITVKKHSNFQDSRCFYVASTDGQTVDFSYIKCLENLIKEKYPDVADAFNSKYFMRQRRQQQQQE